MNTPVKPGLWRTMLKGRTALLYLLPSIILLALFVFYPLLKTIYLSLFLTDQKGNTALYVGFENYATLLETTAFLTSIKTTGLFVLYTVPIGIILALLFALLVNEKLKGFRFFRTMYSSTMGIFVAALSVIWLILFNPSMGVFNRLLSLLNLPQVQWLLDPQWALLSVSVSTIWMNIGFSFLILLGGLKDIDNHLYESSRIDGAGYFYRLRRIILPMLSPTLFFIFTISLINALQSFEQIDLLIQGGLSAPTNHIVYSIYREAFVNYQFGTANTQVIILFLIIFIVTILQFKSGNRKAHYQ